MQLETLLTTLESLEASAYSTWANTMDAYDKIPPGSPFLSYAYSIKEEANDTRKGLAKLIRDLEEHGINSEPVPEGSSLAKHDFNAKNEIANLVSRIESLERSRTNHNQGCETFWASLAETHQAYRSFLASNPSPYIERERLTISRTVAEVLDILTRANKETGA